MFGFNLNANSISAFTSNLIAGAAIGNGNILGDAGLGLPQGLINGLATQAALARLANRFSENGNYRQLAQLLDPHQNLPLNPKQLATVIKETLSLPQDFEKTLELLTTTTDPKAVPGKQGAKNAGLFAQEIPLDAIQDLLKQNNQKAQKQLMTMLQSGDPTVANHGSQVAKLISTLSNMSESMLLSQHKPVETLILLYLPWYPLTGGRQLELELGQASEEGSAQTENSITLYIKTTSLGRFRIQLLEINPQEMAIQVWHEAQSKSYCMQLKAVITSECKRLGINKISFSGKVIPAEKSDRAFQSTSSRTKENTTSTKSDNLSDEGTKQGFKGATRQEDVKQLHIQSSQNISAGLLNLAYFVARSVFEADESGLLLQQRATTSKQQNQAVQAKPSTRRANP